uniref:Response regulator receiver protein n=1 Tax=uncultured Chloroflexota bacterium TaxID=166587 RepID=H5S9B6_9CHLR|nr:response regulator receiver protein [uncultured Chloroflexota bacterium]
MSMSEKIRTVIVDDVAETRESIRKALQFDPGIEVVGVARSAREGIDLVKRLDADVIIMDINMPDMDGITATRIIREQQPHIQVVILSVQGDASYMRRAMLAGARDYLVKPPPLDELLNAVKQAGNLARQERAKSAQLPPTSFVPGAVPVPAIASMALGKVVSVCSPKGGVGRTTVAVNLAVTLQNQDTRVVIVDGSLQFGDVAMFFNEQGKNSVLDLTPRVETLDQEVVESVAIRHAASGVSIISAPFRPEDAERVVPAQFSQLLKYLRRLYAYVIVDTPSYLTDVTLAVLDESDVIILLTTQDIPSLKNARLFLDLLRTLNIDLKKVVFALNRYDKRIAITPERISENLKQQVRAVIPLDERTVVPAVNRGVPFVLEARSQPAARGILELGEAVRSCLRELEAEQK